MKKIYYAGIVFGSRGFDYDEAVSGRIDEAPSFIDDLGDKLGKRLKYSDWSDKRCEELMQTFEDGKVRFSNGFGAFVVLGADKDAVRSKLADMYLSTIEWTPRTNQSPDPK
tara:strand:+ start:9761 stop:10093 length:333 start_codon:yes stop_codon:yes gene_type:complete